MSALQVAGHPPRSQMFSSILCPFLLRALLSRSSRGATHGFWGVGSNDMCVARFASVFLVLVQPNTSEYLNQISQGEYKIGFLWESLVEPLLGVGFHFTRKLRVPGFFLVTTDLVKQHSLISSVVQIENGLSTGEALGHLCKVSVVLSRCCSNVSYISPKCTPDVE